MYILTEQILQLQRLEIDIVCVVQERRSTDFGALKLLDRRSEWWIVAKLMYSYVYEWIIGEGGWL